MTTSEAERAAARRYARAKALFGQALRTAAAQQDAFVAEAAGGDVALARDVLELLAQHRTAPEEDLPGAPRELEIEEPETEDPLLGRSFGGYRLLQHIGAGGMGVVYRAEQDRPRRTVALKLLRYLAAPRRLLRRFAQEPDLLARLQHPHIAQVFASGTLDIDGQPTPFFAMELVADGLALDDYVRRHQLNLPRTLDLAAQVCDAVHHGHQRGVLHRDIKPANVLVDAGGAPKLIDFGVGRVLDRDTVWSSLATEPGQLVGTLQYMSPEQCEAGAEAEHPRSDVYALGVVLYELLTGVLPYDLSGETIVSAAQRVRHVLPPPPSRRAPGVPRELDRVVATAMAKRPTDRYASAAALAADLRAVATGAKPTARGISRWRKAADWIGAHPFGATLVLCALLLVTTATTVWVVARYYALLPDRLVVEADRGAVRLESRAGTELFRWQTPAGVHDAQLVRQPKALGGRLLALVGHGMGSGGLLDGQVAAFDVAARSTAPLWHTARGLEDADAVAHEQSYAAFGIEVFLIAELLPGLPGPELLLAQRLRPHDTTAVRVFDLAGRERYRTWHVGAFTSAAAVGGAGRVVLAGLTSAELWRARGVAAVGWPCVSVALDLRDGHRGPFPSIVDGGRCIDPTVAWYRWLGPSGILPTLPELRTHAHAAGPDHLRIVVAGTAPSQLLLSLELDADGAEVGRWMPQQLAAQGDAGRRALDQLKLLPLAALPPVTPSVPASPRSR